MKIDSHLLEKIMVELCPRKVTGENLPQFMGPLRLLAAGKAAHLMALAVYDRGITVSNSLIVVPDAVLLPADFPFQVIRGSHPIPTSKSFAAGAAVLEFIRQTKEEENVLFLLSGGASALMEQPASGLTETNLQNLHAVFMKSSLPIQEMNTVRKHCSAIKGGQLLEYFKGKKWLTLAISDVPTTKPEMISSGPSMADSTTWQDCLNILAKAKLEQKLPEIVEWLQKAVAEERKDTPERDDPIFAKVENRVILDRQKLVETVNKTLAGQGKILGADFDLNVIEMVEYLQQLRSMDGETDLFILAGEMTVDVRGSGAGGRNQELIMRFLPFLQKGETLVSFATDGVDGITPKPVAGGIANWEVKKRMEESLLDYQSMLANNDSYHFLQGIQGHIITGPTGQNLGDLVIFQRGKTIE